ncbi:acyl-ACP--UDP-N-acetylglucosamine O-acyltransferase [Dichotomicrobium thermohalophilum]|uniref:Acyl-[acyl-carrier-protein]--UDP-N-acetylglucosamine O-acyltransferase n=1 Tax=Dichotomicrobium thermohalophilum TaxID=933063 RepID=A0A397Q541_9HYPH|nr:acyl-ACP--UDP-N-acetylglucosamine O-acyltransferase [Dichotomicrobium thermohalophilum]RIA56436.1 acyl-[acyl-carrier-protein]--UDP-N-acetylglucosamine O-acyltransferase [Dichotomicrobium thermohalophilum]
MTTSSATAAASEGAPVIHPSAVVEPGAVLEEGVRVGAFCVVGPKVRLGRNVQLQSHVVVEGHTTIGEGTTVSPFAALGTPPQDLKYRGEDSRLEIGSNNVIREHVTMNPGTESGRMLTRVGNGNLFMVGAHVAHDCMVGDNVIFANNATLAGHCTVEDNAILGGLCAVHQHVRIGAHAFIGGMSGVENDIIPFGMALGNRAGLAGLNVVGLKRRGFSREQIHRLRQAYRIMFADEGTLSERLDAVEAEFGEDPHVQQIVSFARTESGRALCMPRQNAGISAV